MKKKKNVDEKVYSVEELAEIIQNDDYMKRQPKKPMSIITKTVIFILIISACIFVYFKYIYKPYVYTIDFKADIYRIDEYTLVTKEDGTVFNGSQVVKVGSNVSNIVKYIDYQDDKRAKMVFLTEYGDLYLYNPVSNTYEVYYNDTIKIQSIELKKLDLEEAVEVTFQNGVKGIITKKGILYKAIDNLKIMDEAIYLNEDICVYKYNSNLFICKYSEVSHFDFNLVDFTSSDKLINTFFKSDGSKLVIKEVVYKEFDNILYIYIIDENGKVYVYKINKDKLDEVPNNIMLKEFSLNNTCEKFEDNTLENLIRVKIEGKDRYIEIYKDLLMFGSLSNDYTTISYQSDLVNGRYTVTSGLDGNNRYKENFVSLINDDKNIDLNVVFFNLHDELINLHIYMENNALKYETKRIKLKDNEKVLKLEYEDKKPYITIEEKIYTEYVVFESTTEYKEHRYLLIDYLKGVEYYE